MLTVALSQIDHQTGGTIEDDGSAENAFGAALWFCTRTLPSHQGGETK
jgi:hypothetical protein